MSETTTVIHPTIEGVTQEVPAADLADWKAAGWLDASEGLPKPGSKDDLVRQAEALGLSGDGTKAELEARIAEANGQQ